MKSIILIIVISLAAMSCVTTKPSQMDLLSKLQEANNQYDQKNYTKSSELFEEYYSFLGMQLTQAVQ